MLKVKKRETLRDFLKNKYAKTVYIVGIDSCDFKTKDILKCVTKDSRKYVSKEEMDSFIKVLLVEYEENTSYVYLYKNEHFQELENLIKETFNNKYL